MFISQNKEKGKIMTIKFVLSSFIINEVLGNVFAFRWLKRARSMSGLIIFRH